MRKSAEIDAYPGNARSWEIEERKKYPGAEASEHINGVFGIGSQFHRTHGFYIDGVDEHTASLPPDWQERALFRKVEVAGKTVFAVAPCLEDLIVSKLARLDSKDKEFVETCHAERPLDLRVVEERIRASGFEPAAAERAVTYIRTLAWRPDGVDGGAAS
jgi:hypothetical protein